ncbi:MAG: SDR family oxidoreductase [Puniceicoccaceae bacterium]
MTELKDKNILITGASTGIGAALARKLAAEGAKLGLMARNAEKLEAVAGELGSAATAIPCDITDEAAVKAAFAKFADAMGAPDILINNAGVGYGTVIAETDLADFRAMVDTNMTGVFLCSRAVLPAMLEKSEGQIVNVSSVVGKVANPVAPIYCASKHGLNGFISGLRQQVGPKGVKVSMVSPSAVDTAYWDGRDVDRSKFLKPGEVADVILFILRQPRGVIIEDIDLKAYRPEA